MVTSAAADHSFFSFVPASVKDSSLPLHMLNALDLSHGRGDIGAWRFAASVLHVDPQGQKLAGYIAVHLHLADAEMTAFYQFSH